MMDFAFNKPEEIEKFADRTWLDKINLINNGVTKGQLKGFCKVAGISFEDFSKVLNLHPRTLYITKDDEVFSYNISDTICSIIEVYSKAYKIYKTFRRANMAMREQMRCLVDKSPLEIMGTGVGRSEILSMFSRYEYGIF